MTKVSETIEVHAPVAAVWAIMGDPESISQWHPGIVSSPLAEGTRHCTLDGGGEVDEFIVEHSDDEHFYVYTITASPFEMRDYQSRIALDAVEGGTRIVWDGEFEATDPGASEGMVQVFSGVYVAGLESVRDLAEQ
jgi:uncharacterized protein YndB with AHSA1/START domain